VPAHEARSAAAACWAAAIAQWIPMPSLIWTRAVWQNLSCRSPGSPEITCCHLLLVTAQSRRFLDAPLVAHLPPCTQHALLVTGVRDRPGKVPSKALVISLLVTAGPA